MRVIFLGTPDFAVPTLEAIIQSGFDVVAVVTAPDRPAGRGLQLKSSPIKECAIRHNIPVLQPEKLKDPVFLEELRAFHADIQVVVAFRMLPELVWNMPRLGTWNLHASLLPDFRGAAPINHAIIQGEIETGLSTFKLVHEIDQGAIALQHKLPIGPNETAGELHDRMMIEGAVLLCETLRRIEEGTITLREQSDYTGKKLKEAPKLNPAFCQIHFNQPASTVHNHIRGLSPFPGAWSNLVSGDEKTTFKIFKTLLANDVLNVESPGTVVILEDTHIYVCCNNGWIEILELQLAGKRRMSAREFLIGFRNRENMRLE